MKEIILTKMLVGALKALAKSTKNTIDDKVLEAIEDLLSSNGLTIRW